MPVPVAPFVAAVQRKGQNAAIWTPALPTNGGVLPSHWYISAEGVYQDAARTIPVTSDGDVVGSWGDISANLDHVSQGTTGNKPTWQTGAGDLLNGHPVVRGDGLDDFLKGAFVNGGKMNQPIIVFAVAKLAGVAVDDDKQHTITDGDSSSERLLLIKSRVPTPDEWGIFAGTSLYAGVPDANWNIWCALFNGANSRLWLGGVLRAAGDAGAHSTDGLTVFARHDGLASSNGAFDLAEILLYLALSDADKNQVAGYLATRYGLPWINI